MRTELGRSVILLEKNKHPRFAIGESSTPLSNILLESLATRYDLPGIAPLSKWGSWQQTYPHVACGLKRGFTFYHHVLGTPSYKRSGSSASTASRAPARTIESPTRTGIAPKSIICSSRKLKKLECNIWTRSRCKAFQNRKKRFACKAVATMKTFLFAQNLSSTPLVHAVFSTTLSHCRSRRCPTFLPPRHCSAISPASDVSPIRYQTHASELPPYPVDDAAVHHIFDGGWIWVLQFNNGITSAGVAATDELAGRLRLSEGPAAWQRLLDLIPALKNQFANSQAIQPFTYMPRVSFRSNAVAGKRWALLPSAAGFVDPLLSTGFPLTLLGVSRLAEIIERDWDKPEFAASLQSYASQTDNELLAAAELIAALYATMDRFPAFASLSMLYFAAASFSESARRLGKAHLAPSFLLHDDPRLRSGDASMFSTRQKQLHATGMWMN